MIKVLQQNFSDLEFLLSNEFLLKLKFSHLPVTPASQNIYNIREVFFFPKHEFRDVFLLIIKMFIKMYSSFKNTEFYNNKGKLFALSH